MNIESLYLSNADINAIYNHALSEYSDECCGIITGTDGISIGNIVYKCRNIQNDLHKEDPLKYPRDAKTAYYIAPDEFLKIEKKTRADGMKIKAFYHSHTDHDVYFSEEDKKAALFWDTPIYPEVTYIVVSVYSAKVTDIGFFRWEGDDFKRLHIIPYYPVSLI